MKMNQLAEELEQRLHTLESGTVFIMHPLVHTMYHSTDTERYNKMLEIKSAAVEKAEVEHEIGSYLALHERPYRVEALANALTSWWEPVSEQEYWDQVGWVWADSENIYQYREVWAELLFGEEYFTKCHLMMDKEENKVFQDLPSMVTVYRGGRDAEGLSWTMDENKATWFAARWGKADKVFEKTVPKALVIAYFNGRNEHEIVLHGDHVQTTPIMIADLGKLEENEEND